jgi:hypothetical protein
MPWRTFLEQLRRRQEAARQEYLARAEQTKEAPEEAAPQPSMTLAEVRAEIARIDAQEREEAEASIRRAEELARRREEERQEVAKARKAVANRWIHDPKTMNRELREFDRRQRKKGYR